MAAAPTDLVKDGGGFHEWQVSQPTRTASLAVICVCLCLWLTYHYVCACDLSVCLCLLLFCLSVSVCLSFRSHNPRLAASHHICTCDTTQPYAARAKTAICATALMP